MGLLLVINHSSEKTTHMIIITLIKRRKIHHLLYGNRITLHLNKLEGYFVPNLVEIGPVVLEKILNFVNVFSLYCNYLPLEKDGALHLNKHKFPSLKDVLCQVWLKLAMWFWRRRFWYFIDVFLLFHNYFPLEKETALHLYKLDSPSTKNALCQFGWNWPSGSREEDF